MAHMSVKIIEGTQAVVPQKERILSHSKDGSTYNHREDVGWVYLVQLKHCQVMVRVNAGLPFMKPGKYNPEEIGEKAFIKEVKAHLKDRDLRRNGFGWNG